MKTLPIKESYTSEEIFDNIQTNEGILSFEVSIDLSDEYGVNCGYYVDELPEGYLFEGIHFEPVRVCDGEVIIAIICENTEEWVKNYREIN